jgi:hypothetical protein
MDSRFYARLALVVATLAALLSLGTADSGALTATIGAGAWSWFADPRAVFHAGLHKRTYVGWVGVHGDIRVLSYDYATKTITTAVLQNGVQADDHANPALLVRPDGRLQVFYSAHNGSLMFYRVSTRPEDISSWGPVQFMPASTPSGYTYPNPIRLPAEHRTYLFWRAGDGSPTNSAQVFSTEADGSETWSPSRTLIGGADGRAYVKYASYHGNTIGIAFTNANPLEAPDTNVYFAEDRGDRIYKADGTMEGPLGQPIGSKDADTVYDTGIKGWVHDVAFDSTGHPIIAYAVFPSKSDHVYMYARWDGNKWASHEITHAGGSFDPDKLVPEPYYSGGLSLDHEDPSIVYLSRKVGAAFEIEEWHTNDAGATWTSRTITANSPGGGNYRPVSPRGLRATSGDLSVVWMSGDYRGYIGYRTSIGGVASSTLPVAEYNASSPDSRPFSPLLRGRAPMEVMFDGSPSERPSDRIASFSWDYGDGAHAAGERVAHRYTQVGDHFVTLTVTDANGAKSSFITDVVVDKGKTGGGISVFLIAIPAALILAGALVVGYRRRSAEQISAGHRTSVQP